MTADSPQPIPGSAARNGAASDPVPADPARQPSGAAPGRGAAAGPGPLAGGPPPRNPAPRNPAPRAAAGTGADADLVPEADLVLGDHPVWDDYPDPECGRPVEFAGMTVEELADLEVPARVPLWPVDDPGPAFAQDELLDTAAAGVSLGMFADKAHARLGELSDDELVGVMRAWRRQASWAQARELAAVAELAHRRPAPQAGAAGGGPGGVPWRFSEFVGDEVAAALTMTSMAAGYHLDLALLAHRWTATAGALERGRIDLPRARVLLDALAPLAGEHAAAVQAAVLPRAPQMTTGQLRAAVAKAVLATDPEAAVRARKTAEKDARVEYGIDSAGTGSLSGRCLPPAGALAADQRLGGIARWWKKQGAVAGMDMLRARVYLALLLGQDVTRPPADLLPPASPTQPGGGSEPGGQPDPTSAGQPVPAGFRRNGTGSGPQPAAGRDAAAGGQPAAGPAAALGGQPAAGAAGQVAPLAGSVNLTLPLATLLGWSQAPGEAGRFGPLDAQTARDIAQAAAASPAARWHLTITGTDGQAVAHGCAIRRLGPGQRWRFILDTEPIARGRCDHRNAEPGYRPSLRLAHLVKSRTRRCCYPGCRRQAARCDEDHTIPHDQDGLTCECNLAPLCRFHHRLKQSQGWRLEQTAPGVMTWITPGRRRHTTHPTRQDDTPLPRQQPT
jgi:hypothetical protein